MQPIKGVLLCMCVLFTAIPSVSASDMVPSTDEQSLLSFHAQYQVTRNDSKIGHASISLNTTDSQAVFDYHSKVSRFFLTDERTERSVYQFVDTNSTQLPLMPLSYEYIRSGTGPDDQLFIDFSEKTIQNDEATSVFDRLLNDNQYFRLDIPFRLNQNQLVPSEYEFFNYRGQARTYLVEQKNTQVLKLPIGQVEAHYFVITRPNSTRRVTHAWFAPEYQNQLVRLLQYKDGKEQADMRLKSFTSHALPSNEQ